MLQRKMAFFWLPLFILSCHCIQAQYFSNPSFEGSPAMSVAPPDWYACNEFSTPDTHPAQGNWTTSLSASEGNSYLGLVTRGVNNSENDNTTEAAGIKLNKVFEKGICYSMTVDLGFDPAMTFNTGWEVLDYGHPQHLLVWGGNSSCGKEQLLWSSSVISNTQWKAFTFYFTPAKDYAYFVLEADFQDENNKQYGNIGIDNIRIVKQNFNLGIDKALCKNSEVTLGDSKISGEVLWSTKSTEPEIIVSEVGTYWKQITLTGCILRDTISVESAKPFSIQLGKDISICRGDTLIIDATIQGGNVFEYQWSNGTTDPQVSIYESGNYKVVVNNGCEDHDDDITISTRAICCGLDVPNVFTPNEDGLNDTFKVTTEAVLSQYELKIYNRWGQQVFQSYDPTESWSGKVHGQEASTGVYFWISSVVCSLQNESENKTVKGEVSLVR